MSATKRTKSRKKGSKKAASKPAAKTAVAKDKGAKATGRSRAKKAKRSDRQRKPKRVSALDAAAQVLSMSEEPMGAQALIAAMAEQVLWKSPAGKTPHATLYAAMMREARDKGTASRFRKVDRGLFSINA